MCGERWNRYIESASELNMSPWYLLSSIGRQPVPKSGYELRTLSEYRTIILLKEIEQ